MAQRWSRRSFFGLSSTKIAFARDGTKDTQWTVWDPIVMLTARRE